MRIIDPQSATLTNIEVLAHLTANPPRRPPNPPPNAARNWIPSPDLRDHNTVVKEIHNYIHRLSPHLLTYPKILNTAPPSQNPYEERQDDDTQSAPQPASHPDLTPTPMDNALRDLISRLKPFGLTKAEVLMIVNLGIGVGSGGEGEGEGQVGEGEGENHVNGVGEAEAEGEGMDVDGEGADAGVGADGENHQPEQDQEPPGQEGEGEEGEGGEEDPGDDYGALAVLNTVIEECEERLSREDVPQVLRIIRECLGAGNKDAGVAAGAGG